MSWSDLLEYLTSMKDQPCMKEQVQHYDGEGYYCVGLARGIPDGKLFLANVFETIDEDA